jgi:RNA polymerase sigma factor (sigma-70 family)
MSFAVAAPHVSPLCSENELVAAVRRGDDRAFEQLYSRYRQRIGAYIHGMVGDHGRAEDITQDVFISALRRMRDSERPIAFKPWIYEIAKNACIDDFRRTRRAREVPISGDDELEQTNPRLIGRTQTPHAAIESRQHLTDLRGAFRGLSESHHQIIVLRELEGLSYAEIGERMGMTRPVVESTLFRARRRLSEEYDELVSGRRCTHVQDVITDRGPRAFRSLGIKERRLVARHLAHCQPCRRHAHMHGFDSSVVQPPTVIGKIAALLPIPAFLRFRRGGGTGGGSRAGRAVAAARSHAFNALQSAQSVTASVDPSAPAGGISRVAAAAATLAVAGAGGGIVAVTSSSSPHRTPAIVRVQTASASAARGGHAGGAAASKSLSAGSRGAQSTARSGAGAVSGAASRSGAASGSSAAAVGASSASRGGSTTTTATTSSGSSRGGTATKSGAKGGTAASSVAGAASSLVTGVLNSVPKVNVPKISLPALPPVTLPKVTLPSLPITGSGSPVTLPDPTSVVQKVLQKVGLLP